MGEDIKPETGDETIELKKGLVEAFRTSDKGISCTENPVLAKISENCFLIDCPGSSDSDAWREYTN